MLPCDLNNSFNLRHNRSDDLTHNISMSLILVLVSIVLVIQSCHFLSPLQLRLPVAGW